MQLSREGEMNRNKTPLCGGKREDRLTNLLPKSVQCINENLKKMRGEMESPEEFRSRAKSRLVHDRCEHAATPYYAQRSQMPKVVSMRKMKEGEILEKGTLSNFLQEYESQTNKFRDHITFK